MRSLAIILVAVSLTSVSVGSITSVVPNRTPTDNDLWVTITGDQTQFGQGSETIVTLAKPGSPSIVSNSENIMSTTQLEARFIIPPEADTGWYDVTVEEAMVDTWTLPGGFLVYDNSCGDANNDGTVSVDDWLYLMQYLLDGGPGPIGFSDVDLCGDINIADVVLINNFIFGGGDPPCADKPCDLPNLGCGIMFVCPLEIESPDGDSIPMQLYMFSDTSIAGLTVALSWDSDDIAITSVDFTGSVIPSSGLKMTSFPGGNQLLFGWSELGVGDEIEPQTGGILATLWIQVPVGTPDQTVNLELSFVPPGGETMFCPLWGGQITPTFFDCDETDIVIGGTTPPICGDVNCSGDVDIDDIIYLVNFIFQAGPVPCESCPK